MTKTMKKIFWLLPLLLIACRGDKKQTDSTIFGNEEEESQVVVADDVEADEVEETPNLGKQYTDIEMPKLEGGTARLSDYVRKNKVTVIDCWASWCKPCIEEMPNLATLYRKYQQFGVCVVGVNFDVDFRAWNNTVKIHDMVWPQLGEVKGWNNQMRSVYEVKSIPHTLVIKQNGEIVAEGVRGEALIEAVAKALR